MEKEEQVKSIHKKRGLQQIKLGERKLSVGEKIKLALENQTMETYIWTRLKILT